MIRLADADVLPFEFTNLADTVQTYVKELQELLQQKQDEVARAQPSDRGRRVRGGATIRGSPSPLPKVEAVPPALNFAPLENAADGADRQRAAATNGRSTAARSKVVADAAALRALNARLMQSERAAHSTPPACRAAPWYRHLLYAPGFYTGYGVKTMPGVREGIEQGRYEEAESEVARAARALERLTALIDAASADLEGLAKQ